MAKVYHIGTVICKVWQFFVSIFSGESNPTFQKLFDLVISILELNRFQSVKFNYEHSMKEGASYRLKSCYYTLNESKIDLNSWMVNLIQLALKLSCVANALPVILSIDDTMIEKTGEHFECRSKLFDHANHNGSNYLDGHCFVSLMLSIPVFDGKDSRYIHFPVAYRMWTGEQTKLEMAADLVRSAMKTIGEKRPVYVCCDSWYPKGPMLSLAKEFQNLDMACNVRNDTVLYDIPQETAGRRRRGRPKLYGEKLSLDDFDLKEVPGCDYKIGYRIVRTNLWKSRKVLAFVTQPKSGGAKRLYLCTRIPEEGGFDIHFLPDSAQTLVKADFMLLPLAIYDFRWKIEVSYYEQKTFWAMRDYKLRSKTGIERLMNLLTLTYSAMTLLPYAEPSFAQFKSCSAQETRFLLGNLIRKEKLLSSFADSPEVAKKYPGIASCLRDLVRGLLCSA